MKAIKWVSIIVGGLIVLIILALLLIPMFVDIQKYKPEIEKKVSEAVGRPFTLGGDLQLALFPWAGITLSDLHLGSLPGFEEKDLLSVKSFEVRLKLIPLLSKDVQVKRFIIDGARVVLERNKKGEGNWEGIGKPAAGAPIKAPKEKRKLPEEEPKEGLSIKALAVGEFAITGSALWIDHAKEERKEISDVSLRLKDVSLDRPIQLALSAKLDGKPISLEGSLGPIGKEPGKGAIPLDLAIKALKQLEMTLKGKIIDPTSSQRFELTLQVAPFSPRRLITALGGQTFPVKTSDPEALNMVALKAKVMGDPKNVSLSDGLLELDQSKLSFSARAKDFSRPDVAFDLNLDKIDLDRYLPPSGEKKPGEEEKKAEAAKTEEKKKTDYTPLRRLILDGTLRVGELKAKGAKVQDILLKIVGKDGVFRLDPFSLKLYQGDLSSKGTLDVSKDTPKSDIKLQAKGIQVGPFLQDFLKKDFLEGTLKASMDIALAGDDPEKIKQTLNGQGDLLFSDGAVVGIDLPGMVHNIKEKFGLAEKSGEKPRTNFSEFHAPFTITNGVVNTSDTSLISPLIRVLAAGKADLVNETLDFRVEPKFVTTLKGQGDTKERTGLTVPILVTGNFSAPKFSPDLKGMLKQTLEKGIPKPSELREMLKAPTGEKGESKTMEEKIKGLLKGLPLGR
ncbi:MAG: AsmA family protein [Pseudomonadota bacterium]